MVRAMAVGVSMLCLSAGSLHAANIELLAYWHFNDSDLIVDQGSGIMAIVTGIGSPAMVTYQSGEATTLNAYGAASAGMGLLVGQNQSFQGSSFQWDINMTNCADLVMTWAERKLNTFGSYSNNEVYWRVGNSGAFTLLETEAISTTYSLQTADFSAISGLDGQPLVQIRYTLRRESNNDWNSYNSMDNIQFNAMIPEPSSAFLALVGCALAYSRRRRG